MTPPCAARARAGPAAVSTTIRPLFTSPSKPGSVLERLQQSPVGKLVSRAKAALVPKKKGSSVALGLEELLAMPLHTLLVILNEGKQSKGELRGWGAWVTL